MVDLGRQQKDFEVLELYKTHVMGSFPEMRYEETEVWTKDATGNPVSSIGDLEHSKPAVHQMPQPRRTDHRIENGGRKRANPQGADSVSVR